MKFSVMRGWIRDVAVYGIVGFSATAVDAGIFVFLTQLHPWLRAQYLVTNALGFCLAVLWGYYWHRRLTFRATGGAHEKQLPKFIIVALVGLVVNSVALSVFIELLHIDILVAKVLAIGVTALWNFNAQRYWTFKKPLSPRADEPLPELPA